MIDMNEPGYADPTKPIPPRFWWLKRIVVGVVLLILTLGCLRWWWGAKAHRAFQAEIDRILAAGEPLYPEDFDLPPVPDHQNAALLLKQAADVLTLTQEQKELIIALRGKPEGIRDHIEEVGDILKGHAQSRALVRTARSLPAADWGFRRVGLSTPPPKIMPHDVLIRMLCVASICEHNRGDDAEAVALLRDLLAYGRHVDLLRMLLASLLDYGVSDSVASATEEMGSNLRIADEPTVRDNSSRPATREQVRGLIADLLDEQALREGLVWGFYRERAIQFDGVRMVVDPQAQPNFPIGPGGLWGSVGFMIKPMFELDGVRVLRRATMMVEAASAPNCPEAYRRLPPPFPVPKGHNLQVASRAFSLLLSHQVITGTIESTFKALARRRMAAVALAIRLYEIDHHRLPDTLDALVPVYLPVIPEDPFADDGRKITYRAHAGDAVLRSMGPAGDEGTAVTKGILFSVKNSYLQE